MALMAGRVCVVVCLAVCLAVIVRGQVLSDCQTKEYPPHDSLTLDREIVNLDLLPRQRWAHIVQRKKQEISNFRNYIRHLVTPFVYDWISRKVAQDGLPKLPSELREEIIGIADHLNMNIGDILIGNIFYELEKLCTSIVARDDEGNVFHARNLDLGAMMGWDKKRKDWKITDLVRPLAVNVEFWSNGSPLFKSVQYVGTVGVYTAVKPGKFSFALNSRDPQHRFGGPASVLSWLYTNDDKHKFASLYAREVMQHADSYEEAKHMLSTQPLLAPAFFILAGTSGNQGIVISRSKLGSDQPLELTADRKYLVQTNYDHWKGIPFYDDRRTPAHKCMKKGYRRQQRSMANHTHGKRSAKRKGMSLEWLFNVLSTNPIMNKATVYTSLMSAKHGELSSWRRTCPGNCYPW